MFRSMKIASLAAVALGAIVAQTGGAFALPAMDARPAVVAHEGAVALTQADWHRHGGWHRGWHRHYGWHRGWHRHWR